MRIILGVGNPGSRYQYNRHNVGFMLLDHIAHTFSGSFSASAYDYYCCEGSFNNSDFALIKPATYVNNSGVAAFQALNYYNANVKDLLVIVDDIHLKLASFRVRASGGDGGHNGINSIIYHLASDQFPRVRIGIGNDFKKGALADYVLEDFSSDETEKLKDTFKTCELLIKEFISGGLGAMLNFNSRLPKTNSDIN